MALPLPDELSLLSGRFEARGEVEVWFSDELPEDLVELWPRLLESAEVTGLYPFICRRDDPYQVQDLSEVDAIRLDDVLAGDFVEYRRRRLPYWSNPAAGGDVLPDDDDPEDFGSWPHDPGPPFETWPGLAAGDPGTGAGVSAAEAGGWAVEELLGDEPFVHTCQLALVPARRSADVPAIVGWAAEAPVPLLCALLRSWEERFGARVVSGFGSALTVSVARPPLDVPHAEQLALEHVLSTADNIVDDPPTPFPEYANGLVGRHQWRFWWD
ncbi:DUF4253 domain-containing protein [Streptomyces prunicolor]|uniref:DUF4253 domain-containing protein n=1 Tax=Streptomyces prunicolor TaxID=67348 RepID=A0ABU4F547_9ACTN|nr:DUF4253 domain-containing protein [Streptomyces prunicolor]MDV7215712.1 DUF4253 domain-containing protein [Streptomyces prunicolor]